jgi:hypothetical protein
MLRRPKVKAPIFLLLPFAFLLLPFPHFFPMPARRRKLKQIDLVAAIAVLRERPVGNLITHEFLMMNSYGYSKLRARPVVHE